MERRTAITTAAMTALVIGAAGAAIGANVGILNSEPSSNVGKLTPVVDQAPNTSGVTPSTLVETVFVDEVVRVPGTGPATPNALGSSGSTTSSTGPEFDDDQSDDHGADDFDDDTDSSRHSGGDDDESHEGADDDD